MTAERIMDLRTNIVPDEKLLYLPATALETRASEISQKAHDGVFRKSGEPYFTHCQAVASILKAWGVDSPEALAAAWVHDTVEDCEWITLMYIEEQLGTDVAFIVDGVSKFVASTKEQDEDLETHRKVLNSQFIDPRVALVKLADRVHNMSTLDSMSPKKQKEKAKETFHIYAPLAEALGMWEVKTYLEDISFKYLYPELYAQVKNEIDSDPRLQVDFLSQFSGHISQLVESHGLNINVNIHVGGYWSLYNKREQMASKGKCDHDNYKGVSDVLSVRVITSDDDDCFRAIGVIHKNLGEFIDYSKNNEYLWANKRDNGYEAFQTTVVLPLFGNVEIGVTTKDKEDFNRWGVIHRMKHNNEDLHLYQLKSAFLLIGDQETIRFLPQNATGIDLAYSINDSVGASLINILVDEKEVLPETIYKNASKVRLITGQPRRAPNADIRNAIDKVLPKTRHHIESQIIIARHDELVKRGEQKLETILSPRGFLSLEDINVNVQSLLNNFGLQSLHEFYYYLGVGDSYINRFEKWLDVNGITKEDLHMTSVKISGKDQNGILSGISTFISQHQGNIRSIKLSNENDEFTLRLAIQGLGIENERALCRYLEDSHKYKQIIVV